MRVADGIFFKSLINFIASFAYIIHKHIATAVSLVNIYQTSSVLLFRCIFVFRTAIFASLGTSKPALLNLLSFCLDFYHLPIFHFSLKLS